MFRQLSGRIPRFALGAFAAGAMIAGVLLIATTAMAATHAVTVKNFAFDPASITVNAGDTVTWTNQDSTAHTVTADGGSFDQPLPASGGTATVTFNTAGTFAYHCTIHPNMHGTVVVLAATTSTATASPSSPATSSAPTSTASPVAGSTVAAPATGSGTAASSPSTPLLVLLGGLLAAVGAGAGILSVQRRR